MQMEEAGGLTADGRNWLLAAIDPFHDTPLRLSGYPDAIVSRSVTQLVSQQVTINAPPGITSANWDVNMWIGPSLIQTDLWRYQSGDNGASLDTHNSQSLGGSAGAGILQWCAVPSGTTTDLTDPSFVGDSSHVIGSLGLDRTYVDGPYRVVALGFEVYNETAELYKQGSVCVYRNPTLQAPTTVLHGFNYTDGKYATGDMAAVFLPLQPGNVATAKLMPGSRTWEAKEGCYVVAALGDSDNPVVNTVRRLFIQTHDINDWYHSGFTTTCLTNGFTQGGVAPGIPEGAAIPSMYAPHSFGSSGAYFTGLSPQTTLTIIVNAYIERFPTFDQKDLISLAQPTAKYDPIAAELYSRMLGDMPVGVMVKENGLGEWFAEAVSTIAPILSAGLSLLPHPAAKAASIVTNGAGRIADNYLAQGPQDKAQRKQRRKQSKAAIKTAVQQQKGGQGNVQLAPRQS